MAQRTRQIGQGIRNREQRFVDRGRTRVAGCPVRIRLITGRTHSARRGVPG